MVSKCALKSRATYDDLCAVPDTMVAEILGGELYAFPWPALQHAHAGVRARHRAWRAVPTRPERSERVVVMDEQELHFGAEVLVPNIAAWRRERSPSIARVAHMELAPDWLCEVLSPSTEAVDRSKKFRDLCARARGACLAREPGCMARFDARSRLVRSAGTLWLTLSSERTLSIK
jgi:hypothetical protein